MDWRNVDRQLTHWLLRFHAFCNKKFYLRDLIRYCFMQVERVVNDARKRNSNKKLLG
jgi:hypothetical protein